MNRSASSTGPPAGPDAGPSQHDRSNGGVDEHAHRRDGGHPGRLSGTERLRRHEYLCLVKLTADDGTVGWGESITQFAEANGAVAALIDGLDEFVVGRTPFNPKQYGAA